MNPEHKKYILENINKKSIKELAVKKTTVLISIALIIILGFAVYANSLVRKYNETGTGQT